MSNMLLIARREYLEQIRGRAFKISTIALPLLIAALLAFSYYMDHKAKEGRRFAIVADDAFLANQVRQQMLDDKDAHYSVDVTAPASRKRSAKSGLRTSRTTAFLPSIPPIPKRSRLPLFHSPPLKATSSDACRAR